MDHLVRHQDHLVLHQDHLARRQVHVSVATGGTGCWGSTDGLWRRLEDVAGGQTPAHRHLAVGLPVVFVVAVVLDATVAESHDGRCLLLACQAWLGVPLQPVPRLCRGLVPVRLGPDGLRGAAVLRQVLSVVVARQAYA